MQTIGVDILIFNSHSQFLLTVSSAQQICLKLQYLQIYLTNNVAGVMIDLFFHPIDFALLSSLSSRSTHAHASHT